MNCEQVEELLSAYLDNSLALGETAESALQLKLADCCTPARLSVIAARCLLIFVVLITSLHKCLVSVPV